MTGVQVVFTKVTKEEEAKMRGKVSLSVNVYWWGERGEKTKELITKSLFLLETFFLWADLIFTVLSSFF